MAVIGTCETCNGPIVQVDDLPESDTYCDECLAWQRHWDSLTPEQQAAEIAAMELHALESEGL